MSSFPRRCPRSFSTAVYTPVRPRRLFSVGSAAAPGCQAARARAEVHFCSGVERREQPHQTKEIAAHSMGLSAAPSAHFPLLRLLLPGSRCPRHLGGWGAGGLGAVPLTALDRSGPVRPRATSCPHSAAGQSPGHFRGPSCTHSDAAPPLPALQTSVARPAGLPLFSAGYQQAQATNLRRPYVFQLRRSSAR